MQPERVQRRQRRQVLVAGLGIGAENRVPAVARRRGSARRPARDARAIAKTAATNPSGVAAAAEQRQRGGRRDQRQPEGRSVRMYRHADPRTRRTAAARCRDLPARPEDQAEGDRDQPGHGQNRCAVSCPGFSIEPYRSRRSRFTQRRLQSTSSCPCSTRPVRSRRCSAAFPEGYRPSWSTTDPATDRMRSPPSWARRVVAEPQRGFGAACFAGLSAATSTSSASWTATGRWTRASSTGSPGPSSPASADLVLGTRIAEAGAWPVHARIANRALGLMVRRRAGQADRHRPDARGEAGGAARPRPARPPLRLAARDGAPSRRRRLADRGDPVPYRRREGRSKVTGTVRGTVRTIGDMSKAMRADRTR